METLEKVIAKITVNGKNVTADVSPYLSRLSYADKEEAESDDLTLTFEDTTDHWKNGWYPEQGDTLEVSIGTPDAPLDCGLFEIARRTARRSKSSRLSRSPNTLRRSTG